MIRYQQKNATMGMKLGAAAGGFSQGQQIGKAAVAAAPTIGAGIGAMRGRAAAIAAAGGGAHESLDTCAFFARWWRERRQS